MMLKKHRPLSWFDKHIQTKEDFQYLIVAILIAFIVSIKCYLLFHPYTETIAEVQNPKTVLSQPVIN